MQNSDEALNFSSPGGRTLLGTAGSLRGVNGVVNIHKGNTKARCASASEVAEKRLRTEVLTRAERKF